MVKLKGNPMTLNSCIDLWTKGASTSGFVPKSMDWWRDRPVRYFVGWVTTLLFSLTVSSKGIAMILN